MPSLATRHTGPGLAMGYRQYDHPMVTEEMKSFVGRFPRGSCRMYPVNESDVEVVEHLVFDRIASSHRARARKAGIKEAKWRSRASGCRRNASHWPYSSPPGWSAPPRRAVVSPSGA
jgi:hypothetical protein